MMFADIFVDDDHENQLFKKGMAGMTTGCVVFFLAARTLRNKPAPALVEPADDAAPVNPSALAPALVEPADVAAPVDPNALAPAANSYNLFVPFWNLFNSLWNAANATVDVACILFTLGMFLHHGAKLYLEKYPGTTDSSFATILLETTGSKFRSLLLFDWLFEIFGFIYLNKVGVVLGLGGFVPRLQELLSAASTLLLQLGVVIFVGLAVRINIELEGVEEPGLKWMLALEYIWNDLRWGGLLLSLLVIATLLYMGAGEFELDDDFDEDTDEDTVELYLDHDERYAGLDHDGLGLDAGAP